MSTPRSLEDLFECYRRDGDVAAFEEFYDRLQPELSVFCALRTGRRNRVEDVMNETWLELLSRPERYQAGRPIAGYVLGIARNKARHALRRDTRGGGDGPSESTLVAREARDAAEDRELVETVRERIGRLREPYASVLREYLIEGRATLEIALRLGRRPGTVGMQLDRGLEQLRAMLPAGLAGAALVGISVGGAAEMRRTVVETARSKALARAAIAAGAGGASASLTSTVQALGSVGFLPLALLAALALAVLALFWLGEPASSGRSDWANDLEVARADTSGDSLASATDSPHGVRTDAAREPGPTATDHAGSVGARAAYVRVVPNGVAPDHLPALVYEARVGWQETIVPGTPQTDGSVLVDVRALFGLLAEAEASPGTEGEPHDLLSIRVTHPLYWGEHGVVPWPAARDAGSPDAAPIVPLVFQLRGFIHGRIALDGIDEAEERRALALEVFDPRGKLIGGWGYAGPSIGDGELQVPVRESGDYRIEITSGASMLPCTINADAVVGSITELGTIQLVRGATIEGWLEAGPLTGSDLSDFGVVARPAGADGAERRARSARCESNGTFLMRRLEPGMYELTLATEFGDQWVGALAPPLAVDAPATCVVLGRDGCFVDVTVTDPSATDRESSTVAVPCSNCHKVHARRGSKPEGEPRVALPRIVPSTSDGATAILPAGSTAQVSRSLGISWPSPFDATELQGAREFYDVELVGTQRVRTFLGRGRTVRFFGEGLSPLALRAGDQASPCGLVEEMYWERPANEARAKLTAPAPACVGTLRLSVSAADRALTEVELRVRDQATGTERRSRAGVAADHVECELEPGRYSVEAWIPEEGNGALDWWREASLLVPCRFEFSIEAGSTASAEFNFVRGGRVRMFATGTLPSTEQVRIRVLSPNGADVSVELGQLWDGDPSDHSELSSATWDPSRSARFVRALPAGRYKLEYAFVEDPRPARSIEFDVIAGRSTDVMVPLGE